MTGRTAVRAGKPDLACQKRFYDEAITYHPQRPELENRE
jgi:hypothetical protein